MLFYLTEEIVAAAEQKNLHAISIIENVAMAYRQGKHCVFATRELLLRLINISYYENSKTAQIYQYILSKYTTYGNVINQISLKVIFTVSNSLEIKKNKNGDYREILLPIGEINDFEIFGATNLLGENIAELEFYNYICQYFKEKNNILINTKYVPRHGGGSTMCEVLNSVILQKQCFCLAFVDSDKKYSGCKLGDTLKRVRQSKVTNASCFNSHYLYSSMYREIENMIPLCILLDISQGNVEWRNGYTIIEKIVTNGGCINYYDIKFGISEKKFCTSVSNNASYLRYVQKQIQDAKLKTPEELEVIRNKQNVGDDILLPGLGKNVLERAVNYLNLNFSNWIKNVALPNELDEEWQRIGKEILNWICASSPIRV